MGLPGGSRFPILASASFREVLAAAVAEMTAAGFVDPERVQYWMGLIRTAAERDLLTDRQIEDHARHALGSVFARWVDHGKLIERVPGVPAYALPMIKPQLRSELDRRIIAAADLIKIHRKEAIEKTLQRFNGWSTSIPPGGDGTIDKREVRVDIAKSIAQEKFERRRVAIDQGHKLIANVSNIVAQDAGAIAGEWHDRGEHDKNYDARKEHLARSGKIFVIRDSWAHQEGLIRAPLGVLDEIEMVGQLPYCACFYRYILTPHRLPDAYLTKPGQDWVGEQKERRAA